MSVPLCVDLDGTLIKTDSLLESFLLLIKKNPLYFLIAMIWLFKGVAYFKQEIAKRITFDPSILPYSKNLLTFLKEEHGKGRELLLVTGADKKIAEAISDYLGIFSRVLASDGFNNLIDKNKKNLLCELFGKKNYDYIGDSRSDLKVWEEARFGIIVNASQKIIKRAKQLTRVEKIFYREKNLFFSLLKACRIHQYVKNVLIFAPLLVGHHYVCPNSIFNSFLGFLAFCLLASTVYLVNDLVDLEVLGTNRLVRFRSK